ncbi:hypothetical protein [Acetivibrio ethanolgignens]|uniref:Uncharacterized protein n=1 Tax=Acetivibrio ethanolgignens TaxID=290052 RepID=A0A0V8QDV0_9FIRM|nr:hypothetical protein [Acetivibrio ethanolgignens]KSV58751.1 hypothetical protein ASU35_11855 [Acetivibrio ethanolgignens]
MENKISEEQLKRIAKVVSIPEAHEKGGIFEVDEHVFEVKPHHITLAEICAFNNSPQDEKKEGN